VTEIHEYIAYAIPAGWALLALWAGVSFLRDKAPRDLFWTLLAALQVAVGVQAVIGAILFVMGHRPASRGPSWLHYVYGALFPLFVLVLAHRYARRYESISWVVFGIAAFLVFASTFRALQTGLGVD
jgi:hypothetical protein